ncbi:arsenate reductase (glutaredoxin) [Hyunsoonleella pacifica]|uniref:Arsenate reductase (Glutaredoxin) n=1 Tax=Hyunsoonleella pacifica TaxID=1080224 RepID=A0A4Q9FQ46_9FLAO|nr:arsenate reductase (glutaredoxin) [Hyunsoonleella pacifica]TBN17615.1 arsenate reductase (glutaredoxin) [Hyunsoonleella pacifica]GGD10405.1 arsenate reductase (glutaredoxin) [Hyunsoonleella pacifica]
MITIYHNNRCRKSREGLEILQNSGKEFKIVTYLENIPSKEELKKIINLLDIQPIELVRKNEAIWKSDYKGKELTNDEIIIAMIENPKLIERPIVINKEKAVIGRPPKTILDII